MDLGYGLPALYIYLPNTTCKLSMHSLKNDMRVTSSNSLKSPGPSL